jgi:hypothetical protein
VIKVGRPRKDGTPASKPVQKTEPDAIERIHAIYYEMTAVIGDSVTETEDFTGVNIAVRYGFLCRLVDELGHEIRKERRG